MTNENTKAKPRKGILETRKDASGRTYYLGKIYIQHSRDPKDLVRVQLPENHPTLPNVHPRYSETAARERIAYLQEQEDIHGTLRIAKEAGGAVFRATAGPWSRDHRGVDRPLLRRM